MAVLRRFPGAEADTAGTETGGMPALDGLRILDLTQYEAGTSCTQMLAWLGAEVVKVERPGVGDPGRHFEGPEQDSLFFLSFNSNKRSVTLDLATAEGRRIFLELVKRFDVVTENFTLGTMEKLGLGYDVLRAANPALIYGAIKGFGTSGPYAEYKCYDQVAQAMGGAFSVTGEPDGPPMKPGATMADTGSGVTLALAIVAAYVQRLRTGEGQMIEVSMQEAVTNFMRMQLSLREPFGGRTPRRGNRTGLGGVPSELYPCAPGGPNDYIYLMAVTSRMWDALCIALDRPELAADERFATPEARLAHQELLYAEVAAWTRARTKYEAMEHLARHGVPCGAVQDTAEVLSDPHLRARGAIARVTHPVRGTYDLPAPPFRLSGSQVPVQRAPLLGEHTAAVLTQELDLDPGDLARLGAAGVIEPAPMKA